MLLKTFRLSKPFLNSDVATYIIAFVGREHGPACVGFDRWNYHSLWRQLATAPRLRVGRQPLLGRIICLFIPELDGRGDYRVLNHLFLQAQP
jgi:hypothetical protein